MFRFFFVLFYFQLFGRSENIITSENENCPQFSMCVKTGGTRRGVACSVVCEHVQDLSGEAILLVNVGLSWPCRAA